MATVFTCVFSYNCAGFLKNLVDSWRELIRLGDLAVFDDGSDHPARSCSHRLRQRHRPGRGNAGAAPRVRL